jgi:transcription antitermination factor NusG
MLTRENAVWYAMRAIFHKEMAVKELLDKENIENFIPMRYSFTTKNGHKVRELVPAVTNLIFVHTTPMALKEIKKKNGYLQYIVNSRNKEKIIVSDEQMKRFILVASSCSEKLIYLKPEEINLEKGTLVRIIGGAFDGVEGLFIKMKGARSRRVVVLIRDVIAVTTAEIEPDLIEVIS